MVSRVVIARLQVVEAGFGVVVIATVAEGVNVGLCAGRELYHGLCSLVAA